MNVVLLLTSSTCTLYAALDGPRDVTPSVLVVFWPPACCIPYGLPNSWSDFRSNCCNADGHPRQAGTQFWDEKMSNELAEGRSTFGRYSMVLFAGIAAEALVYGEAEDWENDENMFCSIFVLLQPPLSIAQAHSSSGCHSFGKRG
ncbi:hypothetical protein SLE2022_141650 [Rubroshorea leprosula]